MRYAIIGGTVLILGGLLWALEKKKGYNRS